MNPTPFCGFVALGDSYTIGEGVAPPRRWPAQVTARLRAASTRIGDPVIIAKTGWTTSELAAAMDTAPLDLPYALVTLLIGVNDQYRGQALAGYRDRFDALLRRAVVLAGGAAARVVVVSIPDWGITPFARAAGRDAARIAAEIDAFNAAARAIAGSAGSRWVDVTGISRSPPARGELVGDGLHPSGAQYARWADAILPTARVALSG